MTEELKSSLFEGEKILWEGKPEPFELLDPINKKSILVTWIISAAIILVFLAFYIPFYIRTGGKPTQLITGCIIVGLVPVALSIQPITTKHALDNKVLYLFTDQRAICVNNTQVFYSMMCQCRCPTAALWALSEKMGREKPPQLRRSSI